MAKSLGRRHRSERFKNAHFAQVARLFAQVGFTALSPIAKIDEETRKFLREDLRMARKCSARELSLIQDISPFYETEKPRMASSKGRRGPPYGELVIHPNTERWAVVLSKLTGFLITDQDMANAPPNEFYDASKKQSPLYSYLDS